MKFTCDMKAFRSALTLAGKIVPNKTPIPIALCVKIVTNDDRVTVLGTNFDVSFESTVPAEVSTEGVTVIGFAALNAFCAAAKADSVTITADAKQATVTAGKSRITFAAFDARDFPHYLPAEGDLHTVDSATLCGALKFCAVASSDSEAQYYLNGPYLHDDAGHLRICATDGHSMHTATLDGIPAIGGGGILPADAVGIICTICDKTATFAMMVNDRGWHIQSGSTRAWGKVIEGTFPDYQRVLKTFDGWTDFLPAAKDEVAQALSIAACGADTTNKAKSLVIKATEGQPVVVRGARGASGVVSAGRAETDTKSRSDVALSVSAELLARAIAAMPENDLVLSSVERYGASAVRVRPAQESATATLQAIVMGIRMSEAEMADA